MWPTKEQVLKLLFPYSSSRAARHCRASARLAPPCHAASSHWDTEHWQLRQSINSHKGCWFQTHTLKFTSFHCKDSVQDQKKNKPNMQWSCSFTTASQFHQYLAAKVRKMAAQWRRFPLCICPSTVILMHTFSFVLCNRSISLCKALHWKGFNHPIFNGKFSMLRKWMCFHGNLHQCQLTHPQKGYCKKLEIPIKSSEKF